MAKAAIDFVAALLQLSLPPSPALTLHSEAVEFCVIV
jgi:hypothetical protein